MAVHPKDVVSVQQVQFTACIKMSWTDADFSWYAKQWTSVHKDYDTLCHLSLFQQWRYL